MRGRRVDRPASLSSRCGRGARLRAFALTVALIAGCGSSAATPAPTQAPAAPSATIPAPTAATAGPSTPTPTAPADGKTALLRIDGAVAAGTIDDDTATLYKLYHLFADERLPAEYATPLDPQSHDGEGFLRDLRARFPMLSPAMQDAVGPYLVQPFYAGSWWDIQRRASGGFATAATSPGPSDPPPAVPPCTPRETSNCPISSEWASIESNNGKVRIWYPTAMLAGLHQAGRARSDIDSFLWTELTALMGREPLSDAGYANNGIDPRIDIAIVAGEVRSHVGDMRAEIAECQNSAGYMVLAPYHHHVLAHEFMHLIEFAFPVQGDANICGSWDWIDEGVANWGVNHAYSGDDYGDPSGERFINQLEFPLNFRDDTREYGTWLFWLYLSKTFGPDIIGKIYSARAGEADSLKAVDGAIPGGFAERWQEFARHAWNRDPITSLRDWADFTGSISTALQAQSLDLDGEVDAVIELENVVLDPLSAWHLHYVVPPDVRSLGFYNGLGLAVRSFDSEIGTVLTIGETLPDARGLHIDALLKVNGAWQPPVDWTLVPYRHFCIDAAAERVEEIVLIISNSEFADPTRHLKATGNPTTLFASNLACARWEGEITWTFSTEEGSETVTGRDLVFERDPAQVTPVGGGYSVDYMLTSGTLDWEFDFAVGECTEKGSNTGIRAETFHTLYTMNFVLTGRYYRAASGTVRAAAPETVTTSCPGGGVPPRDHFPMLTFPGGAAPAMVEDDGVTIAGSFREGNLAVEWRLVAVRE